MVWAEKTDPAPGDATKYGAPDIKKISQLFNGDSNVDNVTIDSPIEIQNGKLTIATFTNVGLLTVPDGPTTLVGNDTTDTLENKTIGAAAVDGTLTFNDAKDIAFNTTTGTKIGTATNQKLAFYNATPVDQRTGIADVDSSTVDGTYGAEEAAVIEDLRTKVNALIQVLEDLGLTATV
jgi:hypothetical protein